MRYRVLIEQDEDGFFVAEVPGARVVSPASRRSLRDLRRGLSCGPPAADPRSPRFARIDSLWCLQRGTEPRPGSGASCALDPSHPRPRLASRTGRGTVSVGRDSCPADPCRLNPFAEGGLDQGFPETAPLAPCASGTSAPPDHAGASSCHAYPYAPGSDESAEVGSATSR
jgi:hypothetical protein